MAAQAQHIIRSQPRETIRVTLPEGTVLEGPVGTTIEAFLNHACEQNLFAPTAPLMAAIYDGKLRELSYKVYRDANLIPVALDESDGGRVYRRSLVMLMTTAVDELWPGTLVRVNYAVPDGGFFCEMVNRPPLKEAEVKALNDYMHQIVAEDDPITKGAVPLDEAMALFKARGETDKVALLEYRERQHLTLYTLRSRADYYYGYMVPSTGYLKNFRLNWVTNGFILQYPRRQNPQTLQKITTYKKLSQVFQQTDDWLERMGVSSIGHLNHMVYSERMHELVLVAEALHEQNVASIANDIRHRHRGQGTRLILIAGPSSSGKTTFSKRLAIQLLAHGLRPFTLEMDNYFVNREDTPRDEKGDYDFESIEALNLSLFNEHLNRLMAGEQVQLQTFDFHTGRSQPGRPAQLRANQIIIIEGIHGLNPELVTDVDPQLIYRIYVSALTALNVDLHNRVPTTDVRLLRRITRDAHHRGYSATETLERWQSVRRGEKRNIFPYQENADRMFNSALVYELAALRPLVEPLLLQVEPGTPPHIEANRLLSFLKWVQPLEVDKHPMIPDTSILREFIGGSTLMDYHPTEPLVEE